MHFRMVKEFASVHNTTQIKKLLNVLERDFALSKNPNFKKGGLIGLAAVAVALGKVNTTFKILVCHGIVQVLPNEATPLVY